MGPPPTEADGARVLFSAQLAGLDATGNVRHYADGAEQSFDGVLIATYDKDDSCYVFYTDSTWQVQNDTLHRSIEDAKHSVEQQFPGIMDRLQSAV